MNPGDEAGAASVSERVIRAVADELEEHPVELEPLYSTVDPEALDELFPPTGETPTDAVRQFSFTYEGRVVTVSRGGSVDVFPQGDRNPDQSPLDPTKSATQGRPESPD